LPLVPTIDVKAPIREDHEIPVPEQFGDVSPIALEQSAEEPLGAEPATVRLVLCEAECPDERDEHARRIPLRQRLSLKEGGIDAEICPAHAARLLAR
jgi:hypothetical protein